MPFEKGNQLAANSKRWQSAINKAIDDRTLSRKDKLDELQRIANAMLDRALEGDMTAIKELGDRIDGKVTQIIEQKTELVASVEVLERPQLTKDEWLTKHGVGISSRPAE